jgi:hypothetical protein
MGIGIWFVSDTGQRVSKNVAVFDPSGKAAGKRCQMSTNTNNDTSVSFSCEIDQSGQWSVRVLGIQGESTGSYWVTIERSR